MTTRPTSPSLDISDLCNDNPELDSLLVRIKGAGLKPHFKNLQFDWPVPIIHVLLEANGGDMPAFSHGISAHRDAKKAAVKALMEALQLRSGQELSMEEELKAAVLPLSGRPPELAWADPAFKPVVAHLMDDVVRRQELPNATNLLSADEIISAIQEVGGELFYSILGKMGDLYAVRVFAPDAIPPNPNPIEIAQPRLQKWLASNGLSHPYSDPILT